MIINERREVFVKDRIKVIKVYQFVMRGSHDYPGVFEGQGFPRLVSETLRFFTWVLTSIKLLLPSLKPICMTILMWMMYVLSAS